MLPSSDLFMVDCFPLNAGLYMNLYAQILNYSVMHQIAFASHGNIVHCKINCVKCHTSSCLVTQFQLKISYLFKLLLPALAAICNVFLPVQIPLKLGLLHPWRFQISFGCIIEIWYALTTISINVY